MLLIPVLVQPNRPLNFDLFFILRSSKLYIFVLHHLDLLLMFIYLLFLDEWKKRKNLVSFAHLRAQLSGCIQPPVLLSVMLVAHFRLLCPRSPFLPASATVRSFYGCRGNRGGWSPAEVGEASGCCVIARGCVVRLLTCRGLGGGANSAEELLLAQSGCCSPAAPPWDRAPAASEPVLLSPSASQRAAPTHSALATAGAQVARCPPLSPSRPLPRPRRPQTMDKGSLSPSPRFVRGEACRAVPALVSVDEEEGVWVGGWVGGGPVARMSELSLVKSHVVVWVVTSRNACYYFVLDLSVAFALLFHCCFIFTEISDELNEMKFICLRESEHWKQMTVCYVAETYLSKANFHRLINKHSK